MNSKIIKITPLALLVLLAAAGCSDSKAILEQRAYVYPDLKNTDYSAIDKIDVITEVKLTGNVQQNDALAISGMMYQTASEQLTTSGLYNTTDIVWGNPAGASELSKIIKGKNSRHGHARYVTESQFARAKLYLTLEANVSSSQSTEQLNFTLIDTPYNFFYSTERRDFYVPRPPRRPSSHLQGEAYQRAWDEYRKNLDRERREWLQDIALNRTYSHRHRVANVQVPYSVADKSRETVKQVTHPVSIFQTSMTGKLSVRMVDKNNKTVFAEDYSLSDSHRTSDVNHNAPPTVLRIFTEALRKNIRRNVSSITPHFQSVYFHINKDESDPRAVALLTQRINTSLPDVRSVRAFEDVLILLEPKEEKTADDYNCIGIAYAGIGDYLAAQEAFNKAAGHDDISEDTVQYVGNNVNTVKFLSSNKQKRHPKSRR